MAGFPGCHKEFFGRYLSTKIFNRNPEVAPMGEIEQFLNQHETEGDFDSTGQFSIDGSRALRKFAQHALPRPSAWLIYLGQALMQIGTKSLDAVSYEGQIWLRFQSAEIWPLETFEQSFAFDGPGILPSFRLLRQGLLAAVLPSKATFRYHPVNSPEEVYFDGERLQRRPYVRPSILASLAFNPEKPGEHLLCVDCSLSHQTVDFELRRHLCLAPYRLTSSQVERNSPLEVMTGSERQVVYRFLQGTALQSKLPTSRAPIQTTFEILNQVKKVEMVPMAFCLPRAQDRPVLQKNDHPYSTIGWIHNQAPADTLEFEKYSAPAGRAYFVKDRIVVDDLPLRLVPPSQPQPLFAFSMLVNADHLTLDSSGLQLVRDQACFDAIVNSLQDLLANEQLYPLEDTADVLDYSKDNQGLGMVMGGFSGILFFIGLVANPWVMAGAGLGLWTTLVHQFKTKNLYGEFLAKLQKEFQRFPVHLPQYLARLKKAGSFDNAPDLF